MPPPGSRPKRLRAASSSVPVRRSSASASPLVWRSSTDAGSAADAHVALDLIALVIGGGAQRLRLDLLRHQKPVGGKVHDVGGDRIGERAGFHFVVERQGEIEGRQHVAAAVAGSIGMPAESFRRSMPRSSAAAATGPSTRTRTLAGGFLTSVSAHLEHPVGESQPPPGRHFDGCRGRASPWRCGP